MTSGSLADSITSGRGSVSDWNDKAEKIRRKIQGVQDRGRKDDLNVRLANVLKMYEEGGNLLLLCIVLVQCVLCCIL